MRIFNWMFNKPNRRQETSRRDHSTPSLAHHGSIPNAREEEFIEWPDSLLSIGTFGTNSLKEVKKGFTSDNKIMEQDLSDYTSEELATLVKELEKMELGRGNSTEDQFMDCSTSLTDPNCEDHENIFNESKIVLRGRDLIEDTKSAIKKSSISFLLKKVFACQGGFAPVPAPGLRDLFSQPRMDKLLKSMLRKKIYPQNTTPMPKKYLQKNYNEKLSIGEAVQESGDDGEKWVKTDSDFIVLEI